MTILVCCKCGLQATRLAVKICVCSRVVNSGNENPWFAANACGVHFRQLASRHLWSNLAVKRTNINFVVKRTAADVMCEMHHFWRNPTLVHSIVKTSLFPCLNGLQGREFQINSEQSRRPRLSEINVFFFWVLPVLEETARRKSCFHCLPWSNFTFFVTSLFKVPVCKSRQKRTTTQLLRNLNPHQLLLRFMSQGNRNSQGCLYFPTQPKGRREKRTTP